MTGRKTEEAQKRIINREERTDAGPSSVAEEDLAAGEPLRKARQAGERLTAPQKNLVSPDDRSILRGRDQESRKTTTN